MRPHSLPLIFLLLVGTANGFEYSEINSGINSSYIVYGGVNCSANSNEINCDFRPYSNYTFHIILENDEYTKDFCLLVTHSGLEPYEIAGMHEEVVRGLKMMCMGVKCDPIEIEDCFKELPGKEKKAARVRGNIGSSRNNFHVRLYCKVDGKTTRKDMDINFNPIAEGKIVVEDETTLTEEAAYWEKLWLLLSRIKVLAGENPEATAISAVAILLLAGGILYHLKHD